MRVFANEGGHGGIIIDVGGQGGFRETREYKKRKEKRREEGEEEEEEERRGGGKRKKKRLVEPFARMNK